MTTPVLRLNTKGLDRMSTWLDDLKTSPTLQVPEELMCVGQYAEEVAKDCAVQPILARTRFELGKALQAQFAAWDLEKLYNDKGVWAWLTLNYIDLVMPASNGKRKPKERARSIPAEDYTRRYRHLLRGPWFVVARFVRDGHDLTPLESYLLNPPHTPGELYEQIASRSEQECNANLLAAIRRLYFDETQCKLRTNATSKRRPGTVRRFGKVLNQLLLTYQVELATTEGLMAILPKREFQSANLG